MSKNETEGEIERLKRNYHKSLAEERLTEIGYFIFRFVTSNNENCVTLIENIVTILINCCNSFI